MKKKNYLGNRHLMAEIAASKATYSWALTPAHHHYDVIVRAKPTVPMPGIIRVMTGEHMPYPVAETGEDGKTVRPPRGTPRPIFPPYKHFLFEGDELIEVARSHWRGDLATGSYCQTHGRVTAALGRSWTLLVERYASKPQFRSYSYVDEMRAQALVGLAEHGLKFDESKGSNPFAYFTTIVHNNFIRILNAEKKNQGIRDAQIELAGFTPSINRQMVNSGW